MMPTAPVRIDADVAESASRIAARMNRSAAQQVSHWARVGREVEASASISSKAITQVLSGLQSYDELAVEAQAVVRAVWGEAITSRVSELDLRRRFLAEGRSFVELDHKGHVIRRAPTAD